MDQTSFNAMTQTLGRIPSRRDMLRGLAAAGIGLGSLRLSDTEAAKNKNKNKKGKKVRLCHQGQTIQVSKSAVRGHKKHGDLVGSCPVAPPPPGPALTYQCPGPKNDEISGDGAVRFAQTFTAERSGSLQQIQFNINKKPNTTGDYLVQLLKVVGGKPSLSPADVLAAIAVPDAAVATGSDATLTATFAGPALVAGTEYAAAFSRPGSTSAVPNTRKEGGGGCGGKLFIADGAGEFNEAFNQDTLVSVFVN